MVSSAPSSVRSVAAAHENSPDAYRQTSNSCKFVLQTFLLQFTVLFSCLVGALAYPQQPQPHQQAAQPRAAPQPQAPPLSPTRPPVPIVSLDNTVNHDGSYRYSYEGGDGTKAEQQGQLKNIGEDAGEVSSGSYSYVGDDGKTYSVSYTADETGYHPVAEHLPQPPPIPEAILRSLEYLATAPPPKDEIQEVNQQLQPRQ
ncbi:hypothetical protein AAG570_008447 [Ranatra chinensis]|uniref:Uncharacterized protein n=1 Tax=Ranatra chinensis TaxID=642074 RepID=A0ABD0ZC42_9HEMI